MLITSKIDGRINIDDASRDMFLKTARIGFLHGLMWRIKTDIVNQTLFNALLFVVSTLIYLMMFGEGGRIGPILVEIALYQMLFVLTFNLIVMRISARYQALVDKYLNTDIEKRVSHIKQLDKCVTATRYKCKNDSDLITPIRIKIGGPLGKTITEFSDGFNYKVASELIAISILTEVGVNISRCDYSIFFQINQMELISVKPYNFDII